MSELSEFYDEDILPWDDDGGDVFFVDRDDSGLDHLADLLCGDEQDETDEPDESTPGIPSYLEVFEDPDAL
jgi:hypothetical protein